MILSLLDWSIICFIFPAVEMRVHGWSRRYSGLCIIGSSLLCNCPGCSPCQSVPSVLALAEMSSLDPYSAGGESKGKMKGKGKMEGKVDDESWAGYGDVCADGETKGKGKKGKKGKKAKNKDGEGFTHDFELVDASGPTVPYKEHVYTYAEVDGEPLQLKVHRPQASGSAPPCIINFAGSGFSGTGMRLNHKKLAFFVDGEFAMVACPYRGHRGQNGSVGDGLDSVPAGVCCAIDFFGPMDFELFEAERRRIFVANQLAARDSTNSWGSQSGQMT